MTCPWCAFAGAPRELHAHLADEHGGEVATEERGSGFFYSVTCPICQDKYSHRVKKASRNPAFLEEFEAQIRLVAFDMLLHHLVAEHQAP
ncbi:MAG: hypothetical protein ACYCO3_12590 [Mycobacteriales bacterium]